MSARRHFSADGIRPQEISNILASSRSNPNVCVDARDPMQFQVTKGHDCTPLITNHNLKETLLIIDLGRATRTQQRRITRHEAPSTPSSAMRSRVCRKLCTSSSMLTPGRYVRRSLSCGRMTSSSCSSASIWGRSWSIRDTSAPGRIVLRTNICRSTVPGSRHNTCGRFHEAFECPVRLSLCECVRAAGHDNHATGRAIPLRALVPLASQPGY